MSPVPVSTKKGVGVVKEEQTRYLNWDVKMGKAAEAPLPKRPAEYVEVPFLARPKTVVAELGEET